MGIANAQRLLNYIRIVTEFITQPEYQAVIPMFGIINEALLTTIGRDQLTSFYLEAHDMIRSITGIGEGNGAYISIHDGFQGVSSWADFLPGSDRVILDTHPYFAFDGQPNDDPIATGTGSNAGGVWPGRACSSWGPGVNTSQVAFGVTVAGEFSNGYNDCGFYLKGIPGTTTYGGDCSLWEDYTQWNESTIAGVKAFGMASMDALQNWFFWTWKIANSSTTGTVGSPLWSYQLGVEQGWIPADPREASGTCAAEGVSGPIFDGTYESWQTGGAGAGAIAATARAEFGQWPPAVISGVGGAPVGVLPTYTPTGTVATLPPAQLTASATHTVSSGDGWADPQDTAAGPATIPGCIYPDPWNAISAAVPTVFCGSGVIAPVADETSTTAQAAIITTVSTTALTTALTTATTSSPTLTGIAIPTVTTGIVAPTLTARHIR
jgi:glucan 1,3-beta-glucosidase